MQLNCQISNSPVIPFETALSWIVKLKRYCFIPYNFLLGLKHSCHTIILMSWKHCEIVLYGAMCHVRVPCACFTILCPTSRVPGPASFWQLLPFVFPSSCSARKIFWRKEDFLPLLDRLYWGEMILELKEILLRSLVDRESPLELLSEGGLPEKIISLS